MFGSLHDLRQIQQFGRNNGTSLGRLGSSMGFDTERALSPQRDQASLFHTVGTGVSRAGN